MPENGSKMPENGSKMPENGSKTPEMDENALKTAQKLSAHPDANRDPAVDGIIAG
jgi:hypothetical protein